VAQQLFQTLKPRTFVALSSAIIATLAATTLVNLPNWKDSETLFRHTLEVAPDNFLAHTNLGNALDKSGKLDSAVFHYEEAVRLNPSYPEALNNLGTARARKGRFTEAGPLFTAALARRPEFRLARYNQGLLEAEQGQLRRALSTWLTLLSQDPSYPAARQSLRALAGQRLFPLCPEPGATASLPNAPNGHPVLSTASETPLAPDATFNLEHLAARLEAWQPFPADVSLRQRLSAALPCISRLQ
jgi:tetratricopeptide (TPR) repeat protein